MADEQSKPSIGYIEHVSQTQINSSGYITKSLYPCQLSPPEHIHWRLDQFFLAEGIAIYSDGAVAYSPIIIPKTEIAAFRIWIYIDAWNFEAKLRMKLFYLSKEGEPTSLWTEDLSPADKDKFVFDIPLSNISSDEWFTCSLAVKLITPIPEGPERNRAVASGLESPMMPILIRGAHLEIKG